jgi:hypothetical protein
LVAIEEFDAMIDELCGVFRTELSSLPARLTRDVTLRRTMEREANGMLNRIADIAEANAVRLEGAGSR